MHPKSGTLSPAILQETGSCKVDQDNNLSSFNANIAVDLISGSLPSSTNMVSCDGNRRVQEVETKSTTVIHVSDEVSSGSCNSSCTKEERIVANAAIVESCVSNESVSSQISDSCLKVGPLSDSVFSEQQGEQPQQGTTVVDAARVTTVAQQPLHTPAKKSKLVEELDETVQVEMQVDTAQCSMQVDTVQHEIQVNTVQVGMQVDICEESATPSDSIDKQLVLDDFVDMLE